MKTTKTCFQTKFMTTPVTKSFTFMTINALLGLLRALSMTLITQTAVVHHQLRRYQASLTTIILKSQGLCVGVKIKISPKLGKRSSIPKIITSRSAVSCGDLGDRNRDQELLHKDPEGCRE